MREELLVPEPLEPQELSDEVLERARPQADLVGELLGLERLGDEQFLAHGQRAPARRRSASLSSTPASPSGSSRVASAISSGR